MVEQQPGQKKQTTGGRQSTMETFQETILELRNRPDQLHPLITLIGLVLILVWAFWNTLTWTAGFWVDPLYSHGYLVPIFTLALLWMRREPFEDTTLGARWCGLALLAAGLGMRMVATHFAFVTVEAYSFIPCIVGAFLLVGGWGLIRWAGPAVLFLMFMFPLPSFLKDNILVKLQGVATVASTYVLQTTGIPAHREGNRISIDRQENTPLELGVVDACSGLRMATIFLALAVAIALVIERPWWDRLIILLSAIPIALLVNVVRVTVTAFMYKIAGNSELAQKVAHDWAGWFMMPLALGVLYVELQLLSRLVIEDESSRLVTVGVGKQRGGLIPPG